MFKSFNIQKLLRSETPIILKIAWLIILTLSIFCLGFYIGQCYIKLKISPEVLVNEKFLNSRTIPFPAITICSSINVKANVLNITKFKDDLAHNMSIKQNDMEIMESLSHVCAENRNLFNRIPNKQLINEKAADILNDVFLQTSDILEECKVDEFSGCEKMFIRSLTYIGYCYTFNLLTYNSIFNGGISRDFDSYKRKKPKFSEDMDTNIDLYDDDDNDNELPPWTLEGGYLNDNDDYVLPVRATGWRVFNVRTKVDKDDVLNSYEHRPEAYRLIFHLPNEIPSMLHSFTYADLEKMKFLRIKAQVKKIDHSLEMFPLKKRGCYFADERRLKFFKSYTRINCEHECVLNFTNSKCGCVRVSMLRSKETKICEIKDANCHYQISNNWPGVYYKQKGNKQKFPDFPCNCLPSCTQINYNIIVEHSSELRSNGYFIDGIKSL